MGLKQYMILASGYESSGIKDNQELKFFELDNEEMINNKLDMIKKSKLNTKNITYIETDFNKHWTFELSRC